MKHYTCTHTDAQIENPSSKERYKMKTSNPSHSLPHCTFPTKITTIVSLYFYLKEVMHIQCTYIKTAHVFLFYLHRRTQIVVHLVCLFVCLKHTLEIFPQIHMSTAGPCCPTHTVFSIFHEEKIPIDQPE